MQAVSHIVGKPELKQFLPTSPSNKKSRKSVKNYSIYTQKTPFISVRAKNVTWAYSFNPSSRSTDPISIFFLVWCGHYLQLSLLLTIICAIHTEICTKKFRLPSEIATIMAISPKPLDQIYSSTNLGHWRSERTLIKSYVRLVQL